MTKKKGKKVPVAREIAPDDPEFLERIRELEDAESEDPLGPAPDTTYKPISVAATDEEHRIRKRVEVPKFDPKHSTDPRVRCPHCGEDLAVRFMSPKQQYIQSMAEYGQGPSLRAVSRCWPGLDYYRLRAIKERDKERGDDWDEMRREYQRKLMTTTSDETIKKISQAQARVEADAVEWASITMQRFKLRERERGPNSPLQFKDDKQAIDAFDKLNKITRRNVGLPETSHEVRERVEFVKTVLHQVATMISEVESSPEKLELYALRMEQMRVENDPQYALLDAQERRVIEVQENRENDGG